jgi:hypothetical protein
MFFTIQATKSNVDGITAMRIAKRAMSMYDRYAFIAPCLFGYDVLLLNIPIKHKGGLS